MLSSSSFTLVLLELWICLLVAEASSACNIIDDTAWCGVRNLREVPPLPHYITKVDLSLNDIEEIPEESFKGSEAIQILILDQQNRPLTIRNNAFRRLSDLTEVYLRYNRFLRLEPGAFHGSLKLQTLDLMQCSLNDSILSGESLRPLVSLEKLILKDNQIKRIHPASFFINMSKLHTLDVSQNWVTSLCENDLWDGFQGKHFKLLKFRDVKLTDMNPYWSGWGECGNPFRNMSITELDLSQNGFSVDLAVRFFRAIRGTKIQALDLSSSVSMGKGVWFNNLKDPDQNTFRDLLESGVRVLDLSDARIFALTNSVFSYVPDLEQISLAFNSINHIAPGAFFGLGNLKFLNLSHNLLDKISSETFENLPSLEVLDLSNNNIRMLMRDSFTGLASLALLDLSDNSLQLVDKLAVLPRLQVLYLKGNRIESLYGLPSQTRNALIVEVQNNRLTNAESFYEMLVEFPDIKMIVLGGNFFLWCHLNKNYSVSPLNQLLVLDVHATGLPNLWDQGKCLTIFDGLHQLQTLFLYSNYMQALPKDVFKGLTSLNNLDLSYNLLTYLPAGVFPDSLRFLDLRHNSLGSVDPAALTGLTSVFLLGNRFICDCSLRDFQTWLNQTDVQTDGPVAHLTCEFPEEQRGLPLLAAELRCEDDRDEAAAEQLRFVLFVCCALSVSLICTGTIVYTRLRGHCFKLYRKAISRLIDGTPKEPESDGFEYDVFLCFSLKDIRWVTKALLKKLDSQFSEQGNLRCCFEARDFLPGEDHLSNMHNAISSSKKTLCVLSREFLEDGWCLEAFSIAQSKMLEEVRDLLLVLLVDNIPPYRLMRYEHIRTYIRTRRYLCWPDDSQDLEWFYTQLQKSIAKDVKVKPIQPQHEPNHKPTNHEAMTAV
ncbi:toll-like receptor 5 [Trichomycterus rosablanca]|uniref:toll-like receptor 5 n=1 Tax=Trichomycterus rosablanca TaxID=2290929 RepID=UPI002F3584D7